MRGDDDDDDDDQIKRSNETRKAMYCNITVTHVALAIVAVDKQ